jgi:hypothetical protein
MARMLATMTEKDQRFYMNSIGALVKDLTPPDCVFAVLILPADGSMVRYTGNAARPGMIDALRQLADALEQGRDDVTGGMGDGASLGGS